MKIAKGRSAALGFLILAAACPAPGAAASQYSKIRAAPHLEDSGASRELVAQTTSSFKNFERSLYLWSRQSFEMKKTQELTSLLESMAGPGQAGVHLQFEWPEENAAPDLDLTPQRIQAMIVLAKKSSGQDRQFIEDLTTRVLGMIPQRGDVINIYSLEKKAALSDLFVSPSAILELIKFFIMVGLVLVCLMSLSRLRYDVKTSMERLPDLLGALPGGVVLPEPPRPEPMLSARNPARLGAEAGIMGMGGAGPAVTFSKIDPELMARVLEEEDSRSIAIFISALESDIAGKVLSNLSAAKQEEVAMTLPQMLEPDPREVAQLQAQIHLKLRRLSLEKKA
ncbi:MAG: hypothetical protein HY401_09295 [Elusimicrobia bacterium]|nr:hypothetical protein [Elusimicrobiota bacterium]